MEFQVITIPVGGMTCAACSARVERALSKLDGVEAAAVNLAAEKAQVRFDPEKIRAAAIKQAIVKAGYQALEFSRGGEAEEDRLRKEKAYKALKAKFITAVCLAVPLLYTAMAPMLNLEFLRNSKFPEFLRNSVSYWKLPFPAFLAPMAYPLRYAIAEIILVLPIMAVGYRFYTVGFRNLLRRSPNMDSLIAVGTSAAFLYSLYSVYLITRGDHHAVDALYFETAGVIISLILLGKTLEARSKGRTGEAIKKLMGLSPKTAIVVVEGAETEMPIDEVLPGDIIAVKPGARVPVDGVVTEGQSAVDESMLTGESMPVDKKAGDKVYAATINSSGTFRFRAEKTGGDTALAHIIKLVEDAQGSKAPIAALADVVSGYFVPIVCLIAVAAGAAWFAAASAGAVEMPHGKTAAEFALTIFISVLVIACPCALGLATPTAIMVGTGKGAEQGILIKSGGALEGCGRVDTVVFDKTGTLTEGRPRLTDVVPAAGGVTADELLRLAAAAEKGSEHPLARAVVFAADQKKLELPPLTAFNALAGLGLEAETDGRTILLGNKKLMDERGVALGELEAEAGRLAAEGKTPMFAAVDGRAAGILAAADTAKESARPAIEALRAMGIETVMISGDNRAAAAAVAASLGIGRVLAEVLPGGKSAEIKKLQQEGVRAAMVGDGINDAPALVQADVGIAIGSGTDVAMESADIVLMHSDPLDVARAIQLSRRTIRNIKQNLFWAFGYNTLGIPVAAGLLYLFGGPLLNPMFAAAAMSMSSVSVLANALRLKRFHA